MSRTVRRLLRESSKSLLTFEESKHSRPLAATELRVVEPGAGDQARVVEALAHSPPLRTLDDRRAELLVQDRVDLHRRPPQGLPDERDRGGGHHPCRDRPDDGERRTSPEEQRSGEPRNSRYREDMTDTTAEANGTHSFPSR